MLHIYKLYLQDTCVDLRLGRKRMENDKNKCATKKKFKNQCMVENDEADVVIYSSNKTGLNKQNESLTMGKLV